jgi:hypothetical protein
MTLSDILGIVATAAPAVAAAAGVVGRWLFRTRPARRVLGLQRQGRIDVVATTNHTTRQKPGHAHAHLTAVGELRAIAVASRAVARYYRKKRMSLFLSEEYSIRPEGDLLLLGGPINNAYARGLLDRFNYDHPELAIELDAAGCFLQVGEVVVDKFEQRYTDKGIPRRDLGLVLLSSWTEDTPQRVILCAGFTTYGTEAAARFLFQLATGGAGSLGEIRRAMRHSPVVAVVEADIVAAQVVRARLYQSMLWTYRDGEFVRLEPAQRRMLLPPDDRVPVTTDSMV